MPLNYRPKGYFGAGSVEVSPPAHEGESGIRRLAVHKDSLVTQPAEGIATIPDVVDHAARVHGKGRAMGWRDVLDVHEERIQVSQLHRVQGGGVGGARGLVELGIQKEAVVDMFAETSPNWQIISHACALISTTTATAYDTLGESGLVHSLREPSCVAIFTNAACSPCSQGSPSTPSVNLSSTMARHPLPSLSKYTPCALHQNPIRAIHITTSAPSAATSQRALSRPPAQPRHPCLHHVHLRLHRRAQGRLPTHGNLVAAVAAVQVVFGPHLPAGYRFLAYLPLAHVLEYVVELCALFCAEVQGRPARVPPNVMFGVPAVYETLRKAVLGKVNASGYLVKTAFGVSLKLKKYVGAYVPGVNWVIDNTVLKSVKDALGGEIAWAANGGAAISIETLEFSIGGHAPHPGRAGCAPSSRPRCSPSGPSASPRPASRSSSSTAPTSGTSPPPPPARTAPPPAPRGDAPAAGRDPAPRAALTKGYFNRPDLNADAAIFTPDGWFRTGDIGQWNADGTLSVIDRVKNLVKLQGGEYIALERLEAVYKSSALVANLCVHAAPDTPQPIALVYPHKANLARALGTPGASVAELCADARARKAVLDACNALARKNGFARMEMLADVVLTPQEWTAEDGLLTAAQKVNRKAVAEKFKKEIEDAVKKQKGIERWNAKISFFFAAGIFSKSQCENC
ncbi:hypothetical protein BJ912DRAFT_1060510 [Pholiota molesta]|nr:hypothetical protein BJ912DRAFT_1060510 [Pholiota molesta]